ncbi:MAG: cytochrome-c oxidase, cbb3-type subunit III [Alphaproteobacteria bacterium]
MPTKQEKDKYAAAGTTGHEWDGLQEYNNPLPRWWLYVLWATVLWSVVYWVLYPSWPYVTGYTRGILNYSQHEALDQQIAAARARQGGLYDKLKAQSIEQISADRNLLDFALAGGRAQFAENCSPCHGAGGAGAKGYPTLVDDDWLWGGDLASIAQTIRFGVRSEHADTRVSQMPRFGVDGLLKPEEISDVGDYVLSLSGQAGNAAAIERGSKIFADQCVACHGEDGKGNKEFGAPNLTDRIWLNGGDRKTVIANIANMRMGVMPSWEGRLDDVTMKMLTLYVHSLGGGQ